MQIDDETLMALADGELDPDLAARLTAAIAADPEAQDRLRRFVETRDRLRMLAAGGPQTGADDALIARIRAAAIPSARPVAPPARPALAKTPANRNRAPLAAIAAGLAAMALGIGWWGWNGSAPDGLTPSEIAALERLPSGEGLLLEDGRDLTMIASYRIGSGALCREYEAAGDSVLSVVIACRDADGWQRQLARDMEQDNGYRPASGEIAAVEDWLANAGAGDPLTPEAEVSALTE